MESEEMPIVEEVKGEITVISEIINEYVRKRFGPERMGFVILMFDLGDGGTMSYSSNAVREDMIEALKELVHNLEADKDIKH